MPSDSLKTTARLETTVFKVVIAGEVGLGFALRQKATFKFEHKDFRLRGDISPVIARDVHFHIQVSLYYRELQR